MSREFVIWNWGRDVKNAVRLEEMTGFAQVRHLILGIPFAGNFPENVEFRMNRDTPRDTVLTDFLSNVDSLIVVSERLKDFFEQRKIKSVEYVPVTIVDHKGRPVAPKYFIVHTCDDIDCLDLAQSQPTYSPIRKQAITLVEKMVLDPSRIDPERELFQVKDLDGFTFATRELADAIKAAKFTSIRWLPIADYDPRA